MYVSELAKVACWSWSGGDHLPLVHPAQPLRSPLSLACPTDCWPRIVMEISGHTQLAASTALLAPGMVTLLQCWQSWGRRAGCQCQVPASYQSQDTETGDHFLARYQVRVFPTVTEQNKHQSILPKAFRVSDAAH